MRIQDSKFNDSKIRKGAEDSFSLEAFNFEF